MGLTAIQKTPNIFNKLKNKVFTPKDDWVSVCNKVLGFSFFPIAPMAIAGVICSSMVKDTTNQNTPSPLVQNIAYLHPITQLILPFIDLTLSSLSASLCRLQPFSFLLPLGIWNALNEYKALQLSDEIRNLNKQKEKTHFKLEQTLLNSQIESSTDQLNHINSLLGLFTKVICINLLFAPTYIPLIANIAGDTPHGKSFITQPITSKKIKSLKDYIKLLKTNFIDQEWQAFKNAIKTMFTPTLWRGTLLGKNEKINKITKEKNYGFWRTMHLRVVGGSLKTILCTSIIFLRYLASALFLVSLPVLGLGALNEGSASYTKKDKQKAKDNIISKVIFDLANKFSAIGMWLNGIVPMMAITPSNIKASGLSSTIAMTFFGLFSLFSGISDFLKLDPIIGRSFFYLSKGFACLSNALNNLYRSFLSK